MSLFNSFKVAGSGVMAQSARLNTVASNMANAESVAGSAEDAYKSRKVIFEAELDRASGGRAKPALAVNAKEVVQTQDPAKQIYNPAHPLADENGYVYMPNVDMGQEMVEMIASSRSYQMNAEVMTTAKTLMLKTLGMGE